MAQRNETPTRGQALEELDAIEPGEELDGDAPATEEAGATPRADSDAPAEGAEPEIPEQQEEAPVPPQQSPQWQPPEGGQPFRFRADRREVEVPGALQWDHGIYVPTEAWNGVVSRHLADRDGLNLQHQQEVSYWQNLAQERDPEQNPHVIQAAITLQKFRELMDKGPEAVAKWLDNYAVNRPLLEQQVQNATLQAQLHARSQQISDAEFNAAAQSVGQQLPGYIQGNIEALITQFPEFSELKGSEQKLVEQFWPIARSFLYEDQQGQINTNWDVLGQLLRQEAGRRSEIKRLQAATKHNQRALGNGKTPPKTVPARGRPVPAGQRREYKPGDTQKARDDFLDWDPMADEE